MKTKLLIQLAITGLMATSVAAPVYAMQGKSIFEQAGAQAPQSAKDFKPAAEKIKTRFGNLEFPGGYPTEETVTEGLR